MSASVGGWGRWAPANTWFLGPITAAQTTRRSVQPLSYDSGLRPTDRQTDRQTDR